MTQDQYQYLYEFHKLKYSGNLIIKATNEGMWHNILTHMAALRGNTRVHVPSVLWFDHLKAQPMSNGRFRWLRPLEQAHACKKVLKAFYFRVYKITIGYLRERTCTGYAGQIAYGFRTVSYLSINCVRTNGPTLCPIVWLPYAPEYVDKTS